MNSDMSPYQLSEHTQRMFVLASRRLVAMGLVSIQARKRTYLIEHMAKVMGLRQHGTDLEFVEQFLAWEDPEASYERSIATPPAPPLSWDKGEYRHDTAMRQAAARARATQPELISVSGRKMYVNLGSDNQ